MYVRTDGWMDGWILHVSMCACKYIYVCVCVCVCLRMYTAVYDLYACVCVDVCAYVYMHVCVCVMYEQCAHAYGHQPRHCPYVSACGQLVSCAILYSTYTYIQM
jgi:hypothetical protein